MSYALKVKPGKLDADVYNYARVIREGKHVPEIPHPVEADESTWGVYAIPDPLLKRCLRLVWINHIHHAVVLRYRGEGEVIDPIAEYRVPDSPYVCRDTYWEELHRESGVPILFG